MPYFSPWYFCQFFQVCLLNVEKQTRFHFAIFAICQNSGLLILWSADYIHILLLKQAGKKSCCVGFVLFNQFFQDSFKKAQLVIKEMCCKHIVYCEGLSSSEVLPSPGCHGEREKRIKNSCAEYLYNSKIIAHQGCALINS